jgi:hypothetical protein
VKANNDDSKREILEWPTRAMDANETEQTDNDKRFHARKRKETVEALVRKFAYE